MLAACYTDLKDKIIPNYLTIPLIAAGLLFFFYNFDLFRLSMLLFSYSIILLMWYGGIWGGGDAKLVIGVITLASNNLFFIPAFFFSIGIVSLIHYLIFGMIHEMKEGNARKFVFMSSIMVMSVAFAYMLAVQIIPSLAVVISVAVFFITGDILSRYISATVRKNIDEIEEGSMLAEEICLNGNRVVIRKITPSLFDRFKKHCDDRQYFADDDSIKLFKKYVDDVEIFISYPMAPLLLISFLLAVFIVYQ